MRTKKQTNAVLLMFLLFGLMAACQSAPSPTLTPTITPTPTTLSPLPTETPTPLPTTIEVHVYNPPPDPEGKIKPVFTVDVTALGAIPQSPEEMRLLRAKPEELRDVAQIATMSACSSTLRLNPVVIYTGSLDDGGGDVFADKAAYSAFIDEKGKVICVGGAAVTTDKSGNISLKTGGYRLTDFGRDADLDWNYDGRFVVGYKPSEKGMSYSVPMLQNGEVVVEKRQGQGQAVFDLRIGRLILPPEGATGTLAVYGGIPSLVSGPGVVQTQAHYDQEKTEWVWGEKLYSTDEAEIRRLIEEFLTMKDSELSKYIQLHAFTGGRCGWHSSSLNTEKDRIKGVLGAATATRVAQLRSGCQQPLVLGYIEEGDFQTSKSYPHFSTWQGEVLGVQIIPVHYYNERINNVIVVYLGMRFLSQNGALSKRLVLPFIVTYQEQGGVKGHREMFVPVDCSKGRHLQRYGSSDPNPYKGADNLEDWTDLLQQQIGDVVTFSIYHEIPDEIRAPMDFHKALFNLGRGRADALLLLFLRSYLGEDVDWEKVAADFPYLNQILDPDRIYEFDELQSILFAGTIQMCEKR